jgi:hypothetical protein
LPLAAIPAVYYSAAARIDGQFDVLAARINCIYQVPVSASYGLRDAVEIPLL